MTAWKGDELAKVGAAEEVQIAPLRRDGSPQKPVTEPAAEAGPGEGHERPTRRVAAEPAADVAWIRPRMPATGTLWTPRGLSAAVRGGEAAVTHDIVSHVRRWLE